jgi:uncharacterized Zn-finger protein
LNEEDAGEIPTDSDWSSRNLFTCRICEKKCDGFHMAVSHMKHIHFSAENTEEQQINNSCPLCPKTFRKIDHLKNHVWRHVNRVLPGTN